MGKLKKHLTVAIAIFLSGCAINTTHAPQTNLDRSAKTAPCSSGCPEVPVQLPPFKREQIDKEISPRLAEMSAIESSTMNEYGTRANALLNPLPDVKHNLTPLDLSRAPSTSELMAAGQLGGQLYPTHSYADPQKEAEVNLSFGTAIQEWNKHEYKNAVVLFKKHIEKYPDSPWVAEAQLHMGCDAQYTGRYSEAEDQFKTIMENYGPKATDGAQKMVNKARLRMGVLKTFQNNLDEAGQQFATLLQASDNWRERTYASHWIQRLSGYNTNKLALLNCGSLALAHMLEKDGKSAQAREVRETLPTSTSGQSLKELRELAAAHGYVFEGYRLTPEKLAAVPLPAIVHVQGRDSGDSGHYWVLEKIADGRLELFDAQAGRVFSQSLAEFGREWDGDALVMRSREMTVALGERLSDDELEQTYGGCCGVPASPSHLGKPENSGTCPHGAPTWSVNLINMNLYVQDIPLWFDSPVGPSVEINLSYNSMSSTTQHEPFGNKWQFGYASYLVVDTGGQVTVFMPDGRLDVYSPLTGGGYGRPSGVFNTLTKLAENHFTLTFQDGTVYEYAIPAGTSSLQPFLIKISDPYGKSLTFGYDSSVRMTTITDALGRVTSLTYNTSNLVTKVTDPFGRFASFEYDGTKLVKLTDMGGYASTISYDQNIYVTSIGNARGTWQFYIEPADGISNGSNAFPPPGGGTWENARITITDPEGKSEIYAYNGYSKYSWHVSPNYFVPYVDSYTNSFRSESALKTKYHFTTVNGQGQISSIDYPDGGSVSYAYDSATGLRNKVTDQHGHITSFQFNTQGLPLSVTNAKSKVTTMAYASNGVDLTGITNGLGTVAMAYDGYHKVTSLTDRLGKKTTLTYNTFGQPLTSTDPLGNVTSYTYYSASDAAKYRLKQVSANGKTVLSLTYDSVGRALTSTDATGLTLTYAYDNMDRVTSVTWPDGKKETRVYAGCCPRLIASVTDRAGRTTAYSYDSLKRLTTTTYPDGTLVKYAYDNNGNLTTFTDSNNNATTFAYDALNRLVSKTYADGKGETYSYDKAGLPVGRTGGRGIKASYVFDENHNLTGISYSDGTPAVAYGYDDYDRVISRGDGAGTQSYSYDVNSRLITQNGPWGNDTLTYGYDALGRLTSLQQQGGEALSYTYDNLSRLTGIGVGSRLFSYAYSSTTASPIPLSLTRPNGSVTTFQTDQLNRLLNISTKKSDSTLILSDTFTYGANDQRATETMTDGPATPALTEKLVTYDYNALNQLLASTPPAQAFSYDADGNMTKGYTPDGYQFTATYDGENRLKTIDYTDGLSVAHHTEYKYGADSFLSKRIVDGVETRFARSGYSVLQERDGSNAATRFTVWDPQAPGGIGGLVELSQGGQRFFPYFDGKGNVKGLLDSSQIGVSSYAYDPYGLILAKGGSIDQPFRFSTKSYDEHIGLSYFGYRFYIPTMGRWITRDPIREYGGLNLYIYTENNSINYNDYNGLKVYITGHVAADPLGKITSPDSFHLALIVDPDNPSDFNYCTNSMAWQKKGDNGLIATLGAQKNWRKLVSAINYPGDSLSKSSFLQLVPTPFGQTDAQFIKNLINAANTYQNNLSYSFPSIPSGQMDAGKYNSNSFVSGILVASGATPPTIISNGLFQTPGYGNPIPLNMTPIPR